MVKDLFSIQAKEYSKYRPNYPKEIFRFLNSVVYGHKRAWDCATGSGQAAIGLTPYFDEIIATDISESQLNNAVQHPKIKYLCVKAEESTLGSSSTDLITIATAIHLINKEVFYNEAERILKPEGVLAAWNYTRTIITPEIDRITDYYMYETLGKYWNPDIKAFFLEESKIDLPFDRIQTPEINMTHYWSFEEMINYIYTWSATQGYIQRNNKNPIELFYDDLKKAWGGEGVKKQVSWKFYFKVSRLKS